MEYDSVFKCNEGYMQCNEEKSSKNADQRKEMLKTNDSIYTHFQNRLNMKITNCQFPRAEGLEE